MSNEQCRGCGGRDVTSFCDLGMCPPSNNYLRKGELSNPELHFPLTTFICNTCFLVQTKDFSTSEELFTEDYSYLSSTSLSWLNHSQDYAQMIVKKLGLSKASTITEIASNDGYLLKNFLNLGAKIYGVEPTKLAADIAVSSGITTEVDFFSSSLATALVEKYGHSDLIICNNVLAHVPDIKDFLVGLSILLDANGTITIEFPHLLNLMRFKQYDTIYHEHFSYLSLLALDNLCAELGIFVHEVEKIGTHGGSLRVYLKHKAACLSRTDSVNHILKEETTYGMSDLDTYRAFQAEVFKHKVDIVNFLYNKTTDGKKVYGFGAAAKCNTLLNYCGIKSDVISGVFDNAKSKIGKYMPGSHVEILDMKESHKYSVDVAIIFPWNIAEEIASIILEGNPACEIFTLIPEVRKIG